MRYICISIFLVTSLMTSFSDAGDVGGCGYRTYNATFWSSYFNFTGSQPKLPYSMLYSSDHVTDDLPDNYPDGTQRNMVTHGVMLVENDSEFIFFTIPAALVFTWYGGNSISVFMINSQTGDLKVAEIGIASHLFVTNSNPDDICAIKIARPKKGRYSLFGITDIPGFNQLDVTIHTKQELLNKFPQHSELINSGDNPSAAVA